MKLSQVIEIEDLRGMARRHLPKIVFDWIEEGAGDEAATRGNLESFQRHRFLPRYLRDVSRREQSTTLFGQSHASPFGFTPTGMQGLIRPGGERLMAQAAARAGIPYVLSGLSTTPMEEVAAAAGGRMWYQPYPTADQAIVDDLIRRARDAGATTLVVTADLPVEGLRLRSLRNRRSGRPNPGVVLEALRHPRWILDYLRADPRLQDLAPYARAGASRRELHLLFGREYTPVRAKQTWSDLERYRRLWPRSLVVKGLVSPSDALQAVELGADGIVVSNHGGRQLERAPAPLDVLPQVRAAVGDRAAILLDGGIRRGSDIVTALCLGARFVFIGRAALYGLAAGGQAGVSRAVELLQEEIDLVLGQIGCTAIDQLGPEWLWQPDLPRQGVGAPSRNTLSLVGCAPPVAVPAGPAAARETAGGRAR
ncbi:alpha-hydroxy acid oxidase [Methylobacterium nigriterrae]|uniref:alpha-hydroxy acid oxidase n=1 Tax=Methylobacterium nigriterrae TaxID=3127512 RepID=UPI003013D5EE